MALEQRSGLTVALLRTILQVTGGVTSCVFIMIKALAVEAIETAEERITDDAISRGSRSGQCLNTHWFMSGEDAREKMEAWRRYYNEERPHSAIGNMPPITLANSDGDSSPPY